MFKNIIAPMQAWLLSQGRCVACGMPLDSASETPHKLGSLVTCKCGRIFIKESKNGKYRRALQAEV